MEKMLKVFTASDLNSRCLPGSNVGGQVYRTSLPNQHRVLTGLTHKELCD